MHELSLLFLVLAHTSGDPAAARFNVSCGFRGFHHHDMQREQDSWNIRGRLEVEMRESAAGQTFIVTKRQWWSGENVDGAPPGDKTVLLIEQVTVDPTGKAAVPLITENADAFLDSKQFTAPNRRVAMAAKFVASAAMLFKTARNSSWKEVTKVVPVPVLGPDARTRVTLRRHKSECLRPRDVGCVVGEVVGVTTGGRYSETRIEQLILDRSGRPIRFAGKSFSPLGIETDTLTCTVDLIDARLRASQRRWVPRAE